VEVVVVPTTADDVVLAGADVVVDAVVDDPADVVTAVVVVAPDVAVDVAVVAELQDANTIDMITIPVSNTPKMLFFIFPPLSNTVLAKKSKAGLVKPRLLPGIHHGRGQQLHLALNSTTKLSVPWNSPDRPNLKHG
jgi:hypothetical protein